ncbi:hypothetical protein J6590_064323 [Homalodisca vitripennis]|nr:hypothetical protein J6590_064323 [Homalodisca vitripennis]
MGKGGKRGGTTTNDRRDDQLSTRFNRLFRTTGREGCERVVTFDSYCQVLVDNPTSLRSTSDSRFDRASTYFRNVNLHHFLDVSVNRMRYHIFFKNSKTDLLKEVSKTYCVQRVGHIWLETPYIKGISWLEMTWMAVFDKDVNHRPKLAERNPLEYPQIFRYRRHYLANCWSFHTFSV